MKKESLVNSLQTCKQVLFLYKDIKCHFKSAICVVCGDNLSLILLKCALKHKLVLLYSSIFLLSNDLNFIQVKSCLNKYQSHLPSIHKALGLIPSTAKNNNKFQLRIMRQFPYCYLESSLRMKIAFSTNKVCVLQREF